MGTWSCSMHTECPGPGGLDQMSRAPICVMMGSRYLKRWGMGKAQAWTIAIRRQEKYRSKVEMMKFWTGICSQARLTPKSGCIYTYGQHLKVWGFSSAVFNNNPIHMLQSPPKSLWNIKKVKKCCHENAMSKQLTKTAIMSQFEEMSLLFLCNDHFIFKVVPST